jgi:hypothetical protein
MIGQISIGGVQYPLRYGMSITREFSKVDTAAMEPEDYCSLLIYHAHLCYAKSRQEVPTLKYPDVVDFVENAICKNDAGDLEQIKKVTSDYTESSFTQDLIKAGKEITEEKKSLSSAITSGSPTEN